MCSKRLKRRNEHSPRRKGLQRGGDDRVVFRKEGKRNFLGGQGRPLVGRVDGLCKATVGAEHMAERATYLHLNVLGIDHFHHAHHIVKHQAKLLTVIWGRKILH